VLLAELVLLPELVLFVEWVLLLLLVALLLLLVALLSLLVALLWLLVVPLADVPLEPPSRVTEALLDSTLVVWALLVTELLPVVDVAGIVVWVPETLLWLTLNPGASVPLS
jgi:hypothetical protein